jgi:outer membrane protein TolC
MRMPLRLALGLIPLAGWVHAQVPPTPQISAPGDDPLLASLIQEAMARNPDLGQAKALVDADRERIPQARALPDPTLTLGIQNDSFNRIEVGQMETSFYQVMVTQPLPWPGKRALRGEVARLGADATEAAVSRTRLTVEAEVRRAYTGLLLVRSQLRLLEQQAQLLKEAEGTAKSRYEVGQGSQADLLRAQLERTRADQARARLQAEERNAEGQINKLRGMAPGQGIPTTLTLEQLPDPMPVGPDFLARAEAESPELSAARLGIQQAQRSLDLARLDRHPDFSVSAGVMPRGGLEPMWTASVGITLPLWQKSKQKRAVAEQEYRQRASGWEVEKVSCLLAQRVQERSSDLDASLQVIRLYRAGLLVQSEAAFRATLAQFTVGRQPFVSVLEALNGWIADQSGLIQAQAQAQATRIALLELNLGPTPAIGASALPGGAMGGAPGPAPAKAGAAKAASSEGSSPMSQGGM